MQTDTPPPATPTAAEQQPGAMPAAPAPATLTIDGVAYAIPPLTVPMHRLCDEIDKHLKSIRPKPLDAAILALEDLHRANLPAGAKEKIQTKIIDGVMEGWKDEYAYRPFDPQTVSAWLQSFEGGVWLLWRQLSQKYPDIELAKVRAAVIDQLAASAASAASAVPTTA